MSPLDICERVASFMAEHDFDQVKAACAEVDLAGRAFSPCSCILARLLARQFPNHLFQVGGRISIHAKLGNERIAELEMPEHWAIMRKAFDQGLWAPGYYESGYMPEPRALSI